MEEVNDERNSFKCKTKCFRNGTLFRPGDTLKTDLAHAPKHFEGYVEKHDPDSPDYGKRKKAAPKAKAEKTKAKEENTPVLATQTDTGEADISGTKPPVKG